MSETLSKVRELLRRDSVKLWLPPYTNEDLSEGEIPYDLVLKYSLETGHSQDEILAMVLELRTVATKRLGENKRFSDAGIAVLNVSCQSENHHQETVLETSLTITGLELKERIADKLQIPVNSMKLVAAGNFLTNSETLEDQAVTHNCQILCILLNPEQVEAEQESDFRQLINRTRAAAVRLAKNTDDNLNPHFLRVEDQYGQPLKIPKEENEALAVAMALHERGRTTLKLRDYACALLFFLEADHEFKQCRSDILKCVDNYAILCLDIVWCYLQLRKVDSLPDAGILCFHKRKYADSSNFLDQCEQGIKELEVDDEKLIQADGNEDSRTKSLPRMLRKETPYHVVEITL